MFTSRQTPRLAAVLVPHWADGTDGAQRQVGRLPTMTDDASGNRGPNHLAEQGHRRGPARKAMQYYGLLLYKRNATMLFMHSQSHTTPCNRQQQQGTAVQCEPPHCWDTLRNRSRRLLPLLRHHTSTIYLSHSVIVFIYFNISFT